MTWGEFKAAVEAADRKDGDTLEWVDWASYYGSGVDVIHCESGAVQIDNDWSCR